MIDERTRIRESWAMSMDTLREETLKKEEKKASLKVLPRESNKVLSKVVKLSGLK